MPTPSALTPLRQAASQAVRIRAHLLDRLVNQAGEVIITRSRLEAELSQLRSSLADLTGNLDRLRQQLRDIEVQAESQMQSRLAQAKDSQQGFDPLEFDRFTRVQELTRMMAESVNDVATVQRTLQQTVQATEDDLSAQARQTRELQRDLLRTRMVEFEGISERLYRVVRQASKETGKQVRLDIIGGSIEMDRGVLDRMTPAFEHLLRNGVAHGIEDAATRETRRQGAGRPDQHRAWHHEGNDVSVSFQRRRRRPRCPAHRRTRERAGPDRAGRIADGRRSGRPDLHARLLHGDAGDRTGRPRHRHGRGARRSGRPGRPHRNAQQAGRGHRLQAGAAADHRRDAGGDDARGQRLDRRAVEPGRTGAARTGDRTRERPT